MEAVEIESRKIQRKLRKAAETAFRAQKDSPELAKEAVMARQLGVLLRSADETPRSSLEVPRLPFDRLLLRHSRRYRRSRKIADSMGIRFQAGFISRGRALEVFDPLSSRISFHPFEEELRWILREKIPLKTQAGFIAQCQNFSAVPFHETNHAILFRLLRNPKSRPSPEAIRKYFYLVEALVLVLDVGFALELGAMGQSLEKAGLAYRSWKAADIPEIDVFSFENFRSFVGYTFAACHKPDLKPAQARRLFEKTGVPFMELPLMLTQSGFLGKTNRKWTSQYLRAHGNRLRLPTTAGKQFSGLAVELSEPAVLIGNEKFWIELHQWFKKIFLDGKG